MRTNPIEGWIVFGMVLALAAVPFLVAYAADYVWHRLSEAP
ncbi:hypothetical protein LCGC14_1123520 [marine sediment metagenome]|uniref:Uncharacterized protein n=1 Tax=marine sediment metagenome TaxID=412755 RepID=A0A0F9M3B5_9ZZZZ